MLLYAERMLKVMAHSFYFGPISLRERYSLGIWGFVVQDHDGSHES
jgi:hypothetical protein